MASTKPPKISKCDKVVMWILSLKKLMVVMQIPPLFSPSCFLHSVSLAQKPMMHLTRMETLQSSGILLVGPLMAMLLLLQCTTSNSTATSHLQGGPWVGPGLRKR
ncbi:hypothetical protein L1987_34395 [Smallanthus sonchifolius]|uniref:Uncharacterized protein n=1 Tax=Smallanthus sonchifolius TaxID=185202 RepID=A0ACB9HV40_9ASTR|nr:hypothetical protein L1987_34395 [Smallanthus sonchifolius]